MAKKNRKKEDNYITQTTLISEYGLTKKLIDRFFPEPLLQKVSRNPKVPPIRMWPEKTVNQLLNENRELRIILKKKKAQKEAQARRAKNAESFLNSFSPDMLYEEGRKLTRRFVLHVGPTNSGKTYDAIQALKQAESGVYLGPLRLLALEMFETLNMDECPCDLLTGEEYEGVPFARVTASTIELCDFSRHYKVGVIDEAQMIADPFRGANWTRAICLLDAEEIHVCLAPQALELIKTMLGKMEAPYETVFHDRLVPLEFDGLFGNIREVEPGDALIAFSRKNVLNLAAHLERSGIKASVIYGALPPAARREEVRRFAAKETTVVVATDAIGMGISLPIRRVIFIDTTKFDGEGRRQLNPSEIKQIAGRAGRFGKYDLGQVLTMAEPKLIAEALDEEIPQIDKLIIAFPQEAVTYNYPLSKMLAQWNSLPEEETFRRADMRDAQFLLMTLGGFASGVSKEFIYLLITCPVDVKNTELVGYWKECCISLIKGGTAPRPDFPTTDLEGCELQYRAFDVYHQLMRRIGVEDDCLREKEALCLKINEFLKNEKSDYLKRCRRCGKILPAKVQYGLCEKCYRASFW